MSDNGVAAEDDRSQIKDEGGDDEVRDGLIIQILPRPVHTLPQRLAALQDCKRMGADKKLCRKKYQQ